MLSSEAAEDLKPSTIENPGEAGRPQGQDRTPQDRVQDAVMFGKPEMVYNLLGYQGTYLPDGCELHADNVGGTEVHYHAI